MKIEFISYVSDFLKYGSYYDKLYWFQKYKGKDWIKGQNFGDYLSYVIVGELLKSKSLSLKSFRGRGGKLLALGSVMHFANNEDFVWGTGVNGKIALSKLNFNKLNVCMVRGPLTAEVLKEKNIEVPNIYGDPALLLPHLFPELKPKRIKGKKIVLPNLNEYQICKSKLRGDLQLVSPLGYWKNVVNEILSSELVITSSLHGLIISEIYNVPCKLVVPCGGETLFKYEDYYLGTGRELIIKDNRTFNDIVSTDMGTRGSKPVYNTQNMIKAFPFFLF